MKRIFSIDHIEEWEKDGKKHSRTYATLETGEEAVGYGKGFEVGDAVEYWFDAAHQITKMKKRSE